MARRIDERMAQDLLDDAESVLNSAQKGLQGYRTLTANGAGGLNEIAIAAFLTYQDHGTVAGVFLAVAAITRFLVIEYYKRKGTGQ